jgi:hypothetical protein
MRENTAANMDVIFREGFEEMSSHNLRMFLENIKKKFKKARGTQKT